MLSTTTDAIKAIVSADVTMTSEQKRELVGLVRDFREGRTARGESAPAGSGRCVLYKDAAKRLGCSVSMIRYMRRNGQLVGVAFSGANCHGVTEESLERHLRRRAAGRKEDSGK